MDCDYLECIYRIMFHVKHCKKHNTIYSKVNTEYVSLFIMNFMPIITFSIFIIGKYKAATRRILVVCQFSYVSRETLLKYSNLYNATDAETLVKFRYELCASCRHRALCLSVASLREWRLISARSE